MSKVSEARLAMGCWQNQSQTIEYSQSPNAAARSGLFFYVQSSSNFIQKSAKVYN